MEHGNLRNLEEIQETDGDAKTGAAVKVAIVGLSGACLVFAALALSGRHTPTTTPKADPLGDLVAKGGAEKKGAKSSDLAPHDVTFPGLLSDDANPTTALAAVRPQPGAASASATVPVTMPPPATDRLTVVPLPAQHVLEASPIVTRPRDALTKAATESAQAATDKAPLSPQGREGGYQLQVSSFRTQTEADQFAVQLRARGHKAYVSEAHVAGRGTWYRVRIGPFTSQHAASQYRSGFEGREHVVPFIVPPPSRDKDK